MQTFAFAILSITAFKKKSTKNILKKIFLDTKYNILYLNSPFLFLFSNVVDK